jgi:flagellar hook protein FlgE
MAMDALYSGVSGLQVNQDMLNVVGNNLANSNTTGFKGQSVNFSDLVYQNLNQATASSGSTTGGTNPIQIGSGAKVASISTDFQQGSLQNTGNQLDMAIQGNGFFVVNNGSQNMFTRAGSFAVDSNNYLVDPATGDRVQRYGTIGQGGNNAPAFQVAGNNDIAIPIGTGVPGVATSSVTIQGNLSATASGPVAQILTSSQDFTTGSATAQPPTLQPATVNTTLNSLSDNISPYQDPSATYAGGTLTLQGVDGNGNAVNTTMAVGSQTTLGDVINAINADFTGVTAALSPTGSITITSNTTGPSKINVSISDTNGTLGASNWNNHLFNATTTGQLGATVNSSIQIYDPQGTAHNLNLTFQKQSNNTWNLTGSMSAQDGTMTNSLISGIVFNQDGSFGQVTGSSTMSVQFAGFATPQQLSFNLGTPNTSQGLTQTGSVSSAAASSQNGYAAGSLASIAISQNGVVQGVFTNGQILNVAQLAIASFDNPSGLNRVGNNYYAVGNDSGAALLGTGQSGGNGAVAQGQLESSNVDVSLEFTRLIIAQQGYEVNAHVITSADQILQDLTNIIH